jgi:hypothetical protein
VAKFEEGLLNKDDISRLENISEKIQQGWEEKYKSNNYKAPKKFQSRKVNQDKTRKIDQRYFKDPDLDEVKNLIEMFKTIYQDTIRVVEVWFLKKRTKSYSSKDLKCVWSGPVRSVRSVPIEFPRTCICVNPRNCTYEFPRRFFSVNPRKNKETGDTTTGHDDGDGQQDDGKGQNGDGRHDDGKGQNGDGRHDDGDGLHNDGKGQQGDGQHNDGDGRYDDAARRRQRAARRRRRATRRRAAQRRHGAARRRAAR